MITAAVPRTGSGSPDGPHAKPAVLCLSGVDPSAGAGLARDIMVVHQLGAHPVPVPTCLTVQDTDHLVEAVPVSGPLLRRMVDVATRDIPVSAAKVGALATADVVETVVELLGVRPAVPTVVDPVLRSGAGEPLLDEDGIVVLRDKLIPRATVLTPNLDEAQVLCGLAVAGREDLEEAGRRLCALGAAWVVVKTHDLPGGPADLLTNGRRSWLLAGEPLDADAVHGTGCTFSAALASLLAFGHPVPEAVRRAKRFTERAILRAERPGRGRRVPGGGRRT